MRFIFYKVVVIRVVEVLGYCLVVLPLQNQLFVEPSCSQMDCGIYESF